MTAALTWISGFDESRHNGKYFPEFFVVLEGEQISKIVQKHDVFNVLLGSPVTGFYEGLLWSFLISRDNFQKIDSAVNTF